MHRKKSTHFFAVDVMDVWPSFPSAFRGVTGPIPNACLDCNALKALLCKLGGAAFSSLRILKGVEAESIVRIKILKD